jgi:hypothetical protein
MRPIKIVPRTVGVRVKKNDEGGEFNYDIL